ncbi:similar to Saccharomyces cerevisiae YIL056W VHR1 Transcriptional activator [Maudiozyma saulgeensis]|uniref:Similar to Saccharomyces cerevisiae YIL056W VHR1 Transcriptional activator n=1 Tax=Maudiozyma saulgeensis TaxID=1789683 RepID=A0A1X7QY95_9SACH|nr:similar to Saccharomyces cerevisiae YIL056W VHR1 Transcriptional activator [Kazachstania saulgeensis]
MTINRKEKKQSFNSTKEIRKALKFSDEVKWKRFSNRRYQLIDTFALKDEKASEQDDKISQVADILRTEFSYPVSTAEYFEKLVIVAIQCVRRNMKRSLRRQVNKISKQTTDGHSKSNKGLAKRLIKIQENVKYIKESCNIRGHEILEGVENTNNRKENTSVPSIARSVNRAILVSSSETIVEDPPEIYDNIIRSVLSDIINEVIPFSEQKTKASQKEPDLSNFLTNCEQDMESLISLRTKSEIPFSLKEKLLHNIEKSRTCSDIAKEHDSLDHYNILCNLGKSAYDAALNFVVEKFTQNQIHALEFLSDKSSSDDFISDLSRQLFSTATKIDLSVSLSNTAVIKLFVITVGSLIKDFGFDSILYPLSEMIMQHIMIKYPLDEPKSTVISNLKSASDKKHSVLMTLPINPQLANKEIYRAVTIKYGIKEQNFRFPMLSNGPPTIQEILRNCRALFNISQLNRTSFGLFNEKGLITDDDHLSLLFGEIQSEGLTLFIKPRHQA